MDSIYSRKLRPALLRKQILLALLLSLGGVSFHFVKSMPFSDKLPLLAAICSVVYAVYYAALLFSDRNQVVIAQVTSLTNFIALTLLIHATGGIVSPFVFLYFCALISETLYGVRTPSSLPLAIISYSSVIVGKLMGLLPSMNQFEAQIYQSVPVTLVILVTVTGYMGVAYYFTDLMVSNLRDRLAEENEKKALLLKKFSELNASSHIGVMTHRIVHDLRGPLAAISGYLQMQALDADNTQEDKEALKDLNEVVTGMSATLSSITAFGRVSENRAEVILLPEFMRNLLAIICFSSNSKGVRFVKLYDEDVKASVMVPRGDLQLVCFNIIQNAVEAVRENTRERRIELDIIPDEKNVKIVISDNGPGMTPELISVISRRPMTTKKDGTGIGLAIVRELLLRNGGELVISNRTTGGISAIITLPAHIAPDLH